MSLVTPATLASQETVKPVYTPTTTKTGIWESHTQTFYNQGSEHMQKIIEHMQIQSQMSLHKTHYSHILKKKKKSPILMNVNYKTRNDSFSRWEKTSA